MENQNETIADEIPSWFSTSVAYSMRGELRRAAGDEETADKFNATADNVFEEAPSPNPVMEAPWAARQYVLSQKVNLERRLSGSNAP